MRLSWMAASPSFRMVAVTFDGPPIRRSTRSVAALSETTIISSSRSLIVGFKRASRIVEKEQWEPGPVDPDRFQDPAEGDLHRRIGVCRADIHREMSEGRYDKALESLVGLKPAIDAFFTNVMVNVEDASLRGNRLSLLKDVKECFTSFADFSRIVVQGT